MWEGGEIMVLNLRGGRIVLIEIILARVARLRIVCLISISAKKKLEQTKIKRNELGEGFQPYLPPF